MQSQIRKMTATGVAAVLSATAIAACGGESAPSTGSATPGPQGGARVGVEQDSASKATPSAKQQIARGKSHKGRGAAAETKKTRSSRHDADQSRGKDRRGKHRVSARKILRHSAPARRQFVAKTARNVLLLLGFKHAVVRADRTGTRLTVLIRADEACGHGRNVEAKIQSGMKKAFEFVRSTTVLVGSQQFAGYESANCSTPTLPTARGKVVFNASGHSGETFTDSFTIRHSPWTVAFENDASFLEALLIKGEKQYQPQFLVSQHTETGKETFTGTGTFRFRISASGDWRIRVYD